MGQSLGILLTTGIEHEDAHTVLRLAQAAQAQGMEVRLFVMCDGIYNLRRAAFQDLARGGVQIAVCAHNADERQIAEIEGIPNLTWGSQYDWAQMTAECDRVIAFS